MSSSYQQAFGGAEGGIVTDGIWRFFVKIFSGFLKFLPGRDVNHLSICKGGEEGNHTRPHHGGKSPDPANFLIIPASSDRRLYNSTLPLPLSPSVQAMATDQRKRPSLSPIVPYRSRLAHVVFCLALPFVYNFVAGAIAGVSRIVVSRKVFVQAHVVPVDEQACRKS